LDGNCTASQRLYLLNDVIRFLPARVGRKINRYMSALFGKPDDDRFADPPASPCDKRYFSR
jgi:hypothetical protein